MLYCLRKISYKKVVIKVFLLKIGLLETYSFNYAVIIGIIALFSDKYFFGLPLFEIKNYIYQLNIVRFTLSI